jgi:hypothetical protein
MCYVYLVCAVPSRSGAGKVCVGSAYGPIEQTLMKIYHAEKGVMNIKVKLIYLFTLYTGQTS